MALMSFDAWPRARRAGANRLRNKRLQPAERVALATRGRAGLAGYPWRSAWANPLPPVQPSISKTEVQQHFRQATAVASIHALSSRVRERDGAGIVVSLAITEIGRFYGSGS